MATIQKVAQRDDNIKIKRVLVSCTNKVGLTSGIGMEIEGYPEMKTGLVKSLHPKIHAGIIKLLAPV